jgi:hypothetical protein
MNIPLISQLVHNELLRVSFFVRLQHFQAEEMCDFRHNNFFGVLFIKFAIN